MLFLSDRHNRGLDHIFQFLFRFVPHNNSLTPWVHWHIGIAELNGFNLVGFPMPKCHELFRHYVRFPVPAR